MSTSRERVDLDGLPLLPLFLSCRAAVRAKTSATAAKVQPDERQRRDLQAASREYLALAQDLLRPRAPCLIAIGGLSGSGKSTLARRPGALCRRGARCAHRPQRRDSQDAARRLSVDAPRTRRLHGRCDEARVPDDGRARGHGAHGGPLRDRRCRVREASRSRSDRGVARETGVPFIGLWIDGPPEILATRLRERVTDASDATADVLDPSCAPTSARSTGIVWMDRVTPRRSNSPPSAPTASSNPRPCSPIDSLWPEACRRVACLPPTSQASSPRPGRALPWFSAESSGRWFPIKADVGDAESGHPDSHILECYESAVVRPSSAQHPEGW